MTRCLGCPTAVQSKDRGRAGNQPLADFTKGFVDAFYAKLLFVTDKDGSGNEVQRERRRYANAAMAACRRAWFIGMRADEKTVPASNPFSRMGLKTRSPGQATSATPTATWDELLAFRAEAANRGQRSIAPLHWWPGNGSSARSTSLEPLRSVTTDRRSAPTASALCPPRGLEPTTRD
jgi:hypothetical protein